jgi:thiazole/oxazole-forming peptide maturase SagD family component
VLELWVSAGSGGRQLQATTEAMLRRVLSPLCGLDCAIGFFNRGRGQPRFATVGAELTGVHTFIGAPKPERDVYHIGGSGVMVEEALIRALGETVERYAQFVAGVARQHPVTMATHAEMARRGRVVPAESLRFFTDEQLARPGFPFHPFDPDMPLGWVEAPSLLDGGTLWVPAQLVLVGYAPDRHAGERRLLASVTTGSAAHTRTDRATLNALLELVQIDAAMGHWYSARRAPRIALDDRTDAVRRIVERRFQPHRPRPAFHWLESPDLAGMTVACVLEEPHPQRPAVAVGLGSDLRLEDAMYKALLEAVGVAQLAKLALFYDAVGDRPPAATGDGPPVIHDLNRNVAWYAEPGRATFLASKFDQATVPASALPPDPEPGIRPGLRGLVDAFRASGKDLVLLDLSTSDVRSLGFVAVRVWSSATLSLALPTLPPASHPRFARYGGVRHERPHPYP